jgi:hypothetical protein
MFKDTHFIMVTINRRLLLLVCITCCTRAAPANISHTEHEIPEEEIIQLPIGRFPEPACEYAMLSIDHKGPVVTG